MLYRLEFANVYSFAEPQVIDLRIGAAVPDEPERFAPLWPGGDERAPKVMALFGANASGKSNVLRAAVFLASFVADSFAYRPDLPMPVMRFQGTAMSGPVRFAAEFAGPADPEKASDGVPGCGYRYEVELADGHFSPTRVVHEALFYRPRGASRRRRLFVRNADGQVTAAPEFGLVRLQSALHHILRPDASVIATLAQLAHPLATGLTRSARLIHRNIHLEHVEANDAAVARYLAGNPTTLQRLNRDLERVDLGIREMEIRPGPNGPEAIFRHAGLAGTIGSLFESHGTRRFVRLYPLLAQTLENRRRCVDRRTRPGAASGAAGGSGALVPRPRAQSPRRPALDDMPEPGPA